MLETIALVAGGIWVAVLLSVISLCRAAKWSDDAMDAALARVTADSTPADRVLRTVDLSHAAALLGVSPETLLAWEARFGFPTSSPSERLYNRLDVLALRESISDGASIAAAVAHARDRSKRRRRPNGAWVADHRDGGLAS